MNKWGLFCTCLMALSATTVAHGQTPPADKNAVKPPATKEASDVPEMRPVKALANQYRIQRSTNADHLALPGGSVLDGTFECTRVEMNGQSIPLVRLTAIRGGNGQGRSAQIFLRDGTVQSGELILTDAQFVSKSLGKLKLVADILDLVLLRRSAEDGRPFESVAGYTMQAHGLITALTTLPATPLRLRWMGGEIKAPWQQIALIKPRPRPETTHDVLFADGTHIVAWVFADSPPFLAFARQLASLHGAVEDAAATTGKAGWPAALTTTDGSRWHGEWVQASLDIESAGASISIRTADIQRVTATAGGQVEIATPPGAVIRGIIGGEAIAWKTSLGVLSVPWRFVSSVGGITK